MVASPPPATSTSAASVAVGTASAISAAGVPFRCTGSVSASAPMARMTAVGHDDA